MKDIVKQNITIHTSQVLFDRMNHYTDHLGNIRLSYGRDPKTNKIAILKESHYYPFGLQHQGYVTNHKIFDPIAPIGRVNLIPVRNYLDDSYRYTFGGKEEELELGLNWLDFHARNYDAALGRWMNVDPLGDVAPSWSPYRYGFNNPMRFVDPTGMLEEKKDPPISVNESNPIQLDEVFITNKRGTAGTAQGSHIKSTDIGTRFYGFRVEGQLDGKYGNANGDISGFSAGYDAYTEPGGAHFYTSAYGLIADVGVRAGTLDHNLSLTGEGNIFSAEVGGDVGFYTGKVGKYGAELVGQAGAYALKGEFTPSVTVFGVEIGVTLGGSLGSAHIGAQGIGTFDSNTKKFEATGKAHIGLGAGLKLGFTISNTKQRIYTPKNIQKKK